MTMPPITSTYLMNEKGCLSLFVSGAATKPERSPTRTTNMTSRSSTVIDAAVLQKKTSERYIHYTRIRSRYITSNVNKNDNSLRKPDTKYQPYALRHSWPMPTKNTNKQCICHVLVFPRQYLSTLLYILSIKLHLLYLCVRWSRLFANFLCCTHFAELQKQSPDTQNYLHSLSLPYSST